MRKEQGKTVNEKMSIWVWYSDAPHGGYLFEGNPNRGAPPFHLGGIENLLCGELLVWEYTRKGLEMDTDVAWWNRDCPKFKVYPKCVTVEIRRQEKDNKKGSPVPKEPKIHGYTIPEYVNLIEKAHKASKKSTLVFKEKEA